MGVVESTADSQLNFIIYSNSKQGTEEDAKKNRQTQPKKYCLPTGVTGEQLTRIVLKYLRENPEKHHLTAAHLVKQALIKAFPKPGNTLFCMR